MSALTLDKVKSYATEENLDAALKRLGLDDYGYGEGSVTCQYIKVRTPEGRWTAIFLVSQFFNRMGTGGYIAFASQHGFMSV